MIFLQSKGLSSITTIQRRQFFSAQPSLGFPRALGRIRLQCERPGFDPWVGKIPWRRAWQPTPVFLPGESHGQRSLAGYIPRGLKKSDTTEQPSTQHTACFMVQFSCSRVIYSDKGQHIDKHYSVDELPGNYTDRKKLIPSVHMLYAFIYTAFLHWHNNGEQISGCLGLRMEQRWERSGCGCETVLRGILVMERSVP